MLKYVIGKFLFIKLFILLEVIDRPVQVIDLIGFRNFELFIQPPGDKILCQAEIILCLIIVVSHRLQFQELILPILGLISGVLTVNDADPETFLFFYIKNKTGFVGLLEANALVMIYTKVRI